MKARRPRDRHHNLPVDIKLHRTSLRPQPKHPYSPAFGGQYDRQMQVVLVQPEIAPNTGAIIRLCANTGADLHLVEPLGFSLDDRLLKRGGLDYHEYASVQIHPSIQALAGAVPGRWFGFSARAERTYTDVAFSDDDVIVFGPERSGLQDSVGGLIPPDRMLTIPMRPGSRSMNLANAVSVVLYEAWRQAGFGGAGTGGTELTVETIASRPPR